MSSSAAAAAPIPTSPLARPSTQIALSIVGSVCGTLATGAAGSSPTGQLIGAALGAAIPTLISVVGPGHEVRVGAGIAITALALLVTYGGATARDFATDSPATFPLPPGVSEPDGQERGQEPNPGGVTPQHTASQSVTQSDREGREIRVTPKVLACTTTACPRTVRIRSTGETAFTVTSIEIEDDDGSFQHDGACVGATIPPGADCRLGVRYAPTSGDEPRDATLVIHQTLAGDPTRVRLKGTGPGVATPAVDFAAPNVNACSFATGDSGRLQAELSVSVRATEVSDGTPETVRVTAGVDAVESDVADVPVNGEAVNFVVPIAEEATRAGLVITAVADSSREVSERDEDNNVTAITAASVPAAGAACSA